jgi:serine/threonine-protein kinase
MEYLEGETLAAYLQRAGRLPWPIACAIGRQLADAVGAAHGSGIVHRDLKPDNVFLWSGEPRAAGPGLAVKVLDFGIAKLLSPEARAERVTRNGILLGTPRYTSPEQYCGAAEVDQRTDVYSLGCIVFEMICGAPPFVLDRLQALMAAHMFEPPPAASQVVPAIPAWLDQLLLRMLAKSPEERPASMVEVAGVLASGEVGLEDRREDRLEDRLDHPREDRPGEPETDALDSKASTSAPAKHRTTVVRAASLAVAAGGIAGLLLALWSPPRARSPPSAPKALAAATDPAPQVNPPAGLDHARPVDGVGAPAGPGRDAAVALAPAVPPPPAVVPAASGSARRSRAASARSKRLEKPRPAASEEMDGIVDL